MKKNIIKRFVPIALVLVIILNFNFPVNATYYATEREPNNTTSSAQLVNLDTEVSGYISNGDVDYFKYTTSSYKSIYIDFGGNPEDIGITIKVGNSIEIADMQGSYAFMPEINKTYYIYVSRIDPSKTVSEFYTLRVLPD